MSTSESSDREVGTFGQLAGLIDQQADLLERAGTLMRDPLAPFSAVELG
jgi:hypothetical protein